MSTIRRTVLFTLTALVAAAAVALPAEARESGTSSKIVGGVEARPGIWPWMTAITSTASGAPQQRHCGGTLVAADVVLTAAHCVAGAPEPGRYRAILGRHDLGRPDGQVFAVTAIALHPEYDPSHVVHDFALLKLERPAPQPVATVMADDSGLLVGDAAAFMGWGATSETEHTYADQLQVGVGDLLATSECQQMMEYFGHRFDPSAQLCVGTQLSGMDTCHGDSGGPLMVGSATDGWQLIGVVSWAHVDDGGASCGTGWPAVYGRVGTQAFHGWMQSAIDLLHEPPVRDVGGDDTKTDPHQDDGNHDDHTVVQAPPAPTRLRLEPATFRAGRGTTIRLRAPRGTTIVFTVRTRSGRQVSGSLEGTAKSATSSFRFTGRIGGTRLRRGRYVLEARAVHADGPLSAPARAAFRVKRAG